MKPFFAGRLFVCGAILGTGLFLHPTEASAQSQGFPIPFRRALTNYDLVRSFSTHANPTGVWRYGWKQTPAGELTLLTFPQRSPATDGNATFLWQLNERQSPSVGVRLVKAGPSSSPGFGSALLEPGMNGAPENFGAARFTVPPGGSGNYRIECFARHHDDAAPGDTEFLVVHDKQPLFDGFVNGGEPLGFTNVLFLSEGNGVDFVVGRGQDRDRTGSTLQISARILALELEPSVRPLVTTHPRERSLPEGTTAVLVAAATGTAPLSYQWLLDGKPVSGQTNASLTIPKLRQADAGLYSVRITNRIGQARSSNALLRVYSPADNLVANGGFEEGLDPGLSTQLDTSHTNAIHSWVIQSGSIDYVGPRWTAFDGARCVDLSGTSPGALQQQIVGLKIGQRYRVTFQLAVNPESPPASTTVLLAVAGVTNRFEATEEGTKADLRWAEKTVEFTASESNAVVYFRSLNRGWSGPIIDAVSCLPIVARKE